MNNLEFVYDLSSSSRIDAYLSEVSEFSRSRITMLIEEGAVLLNGNPTNKKAKLKNGDVIILSVPEPVEYTAKPENIPLQIVFEDEHLLVVNKPKGMVVHPAAGNYEGTLVNALLYYCKDSLSGINGVLRPGIVHRIDKNTSGLLMVAKNDAAHIGLAQQIKDHNFVREYEAVVYGNVKNDSGIINAPIDRHPQKRKQMAIVNGGREAITHYSVIERFGEFTHLRLKLETGRTHQIRVHMASIGHPVAGDDVYGPKKVITSLSGQCLHAKKLGFIHPITNEYLEFESDLPEYFTKFIERIKLNGTL